MIAEGPKPQVPYRRTFVRLLGFLRPYRWSLAVSVVLAVASQAAAIALVRATEFAIDDAIVPRDADALWWLLGVIVALGLVRAVLMLGRRFISGRQALGVEYDMRNALYSHLLRLSFRFYDTHQTGQLMSRATVDLQAVRFFLGYGLIFFFQHVLTVIGVTAVMLAVNWRLALVAGAITVSYTHLTLPTNREV